MKKILALFLLSISISFATTVTFNGVDVTLNGNGLKVGDSAPVFNAVNIDFEEVVVGGKKRKVQVIAFVPSLDSDICKLQTVTFNKNISELENVELTVVSKDLPFAQKRFCQDNGIKNIQTVSDYKDVNNALRYGTTISSPVFLEGLFARVTYIVDTQGKIAYVQVVKEIAKEPDYNEIMNALRNIK